MELANKPEEIKIIAGYIDIYTKLTWRKSLFIVCLLAVLAVTAIAAISIGAATLDLGESVTALLSSVFPVESSNFARTVILDLRLPRILLAILAGLGLGVSGAVMQGVLRNPLVSPYTLGLSSGAACGAALAIVFGARAAIFGSYLTVASAFIFGLLTMLFVLGFSKIRATSIETLVLAGVALGYLFSAIISALKYASGNEQLREIVLWLMGDISGANWQCILTILPIIIIFTVIAMRYSWDLNIMGAGDEVATSLGIKVDRIRIINLFIAAILTASIIAYTGIIGFIGLVSPHICRLIIGNDHRFLIPSSGIMGALTLVISDTICRTVIQPTEVPVGIITAMIGVPFFLYLLMRKRRRWWQ